MTLTKVQKLINQFEASGFEESEKIELDNLDRAKLVYSYGEGIVMVENEHGTLFPVSDLSNEEIDIFASILPSLSKKERQLNSKKMNYYDIHVFYSRSNGFSVPFKSTLEDEDDIINEAVIAGKIDADDADSVDSVDEITEDEYLLMGGK